MAERTKPLVGRAPASGDGDGSALLEWAMLAVIVVAALLTRPLVTLARFCARRGWRHGAWLAYRAAAPIEGLVPRDMPANAHPVKRSWRIAALALAGAMFLTVWVCHVLAVS